MGSNTGVSEPLGSYWRGVTLKVVKRPKEDDRGHLDHQFGVVLDLHLRLVGTCRGRSESSPALLALDPGNQCIKNTELRPLAVQERVLWHLSVVLFDRNHGVLEL